MILFIILSKIIVLILTLKIKDINTLYSVTKYKNIIISFLEYQE